MATTTRLSNVRGAGPAIEWELKNCKQIKMFEIGMGPTVAQDTLLRNDLLSQYIGGHRSQWK